MARLKLWLFLKGLGALVNNFRLESFCVMSSMDDVGAVVMILGARQEQLAFKSISASAEATYEPRPLTIWFVPS